MRTDLHVHTHFSFDSQTDIQRACRQAVQAGLTHIGFNDHFDLDPSSKEKGYDQSAFFDEIKAAFKEARETKGMPTAIIAMTIKGKGVSFMENQAGWHGTAPNDEQYEQAMNELGGEDHE